MFIFSNLATTLDGKIAPADRSLFLLGTPEDHKQMQRLRQRCDVVLFGASTLRAFPCLRQDFAARLTQPNTTLRRTPRTRGRDISGKDFPNPEKSFAKTETQDTNGHDGCRDHEDVFNHGLALFIPMQAEQKFTQFPAY